MHEYAWFHIDNESEIASPALLLYEERIEHNLRLMIQIAGDVHRLRPHVKTHKLLPLVQRQIELGITKFKCSTIAEVEMCAMAGAADVLLAMPCVGPNGHRLAKLAQAYIAQLAVAKTWPGKIVTTLEPGKPFYPAETYHQDFMAKNPRHPYILAWDAAKVAALKKRFPGFYKPDFTTG